MKTSEEILALKMTLKTISVKVKRIENVNKKLKKLVLERENGKSPEPEIKNPRRRINYFDRLNMEQRMKNIMPLE